MSDIWRAQYLNYLNSTEWRIRRNAAIKASGEKCARCGSVNSLEVHHLHYRTLGCESLTDLLVVCKECHKHEDAKRDAQTHDRHVQKRFEGWLRKRYQHNWECFVDDEIEWDRFNDFLENQF